MEETGKPGSHLSSASAFVEGGIQHAFDDACSICLEDFCISDPSTLAVGGNNVGMEDHFFQHSATAASIGRAHHSLRRERVRSGSLEHSRYLSSPNSNTPSGIPVLVSTPIGADSERVHATIATESLASTTTPVREYAGVTNVSPDHSTQIALLTSGHLLDNHLQSTKMDQGHQTCNPYQNL